MRMLHLLQVRVFRVGPLVLVDGVLLDSLHGGAGEGHGAQPGLLLLGC